MIVPRNRRPITPGQVLREDFVEPLGLTQGKVAEALGVDRTTINEIMNDRRSITPDMALRLAQSTDTSPEYWMQLQLAVDLFDALRALDRTEVRRLAALSARPSTAASPRSG
jgi:addiction module HigA family antidote